MRYKWSSIQSLCGESRLRPPFHLAIPVGDLAASALFYEGTLGLRRGRSSEHWVDYDFFGHQLVLHEVQSPEIDIASQPVDGEDVPIPHFGVVLPWDDYDDFIFGLTQKGVPLRIPTTIRFEGRAGEQKTTFVCDPEGNCLEFKAFRDPEMLFASDLGAY